MINSNVIYIEKNLEIADLKKKAKEERFIPLDGSKENIYKATEKAKAQYLLAERYAAGEGCDTMPYRAFKYYKKALANCNALSKVSVNGEIQELQKCVNYRIARCYEKGRGVGSNAEMARWHYHAADEPSSAPAAHRLAKIYIKEGKTAEALKLLYRAIGKDCVKAHVTLGDLYAEGQEGLPQNLKEAEACYVNFLRKNPTGEVLYKLSQLYLLMGHAEDGLWYIQKAAMAGYQAAIYDLAHRREEGRGFKQDEKEALELYLALAKGGFHEAFVDIVRVMQKLFKRDQAAQEQRFNHKQKEFEHDLTLRQGAAIRAMELKIAAEAAERMAQEKTLTAQLTEQGATLTHEREALSSIFDNKQEALEKKLTEQFSACMAKVEEAKQQQRFLEQAAKEQQSQAIAAMELKLAAEAAERMAQEKALTAQLKEQGAALALERQALSGVFGQNQKALEEKLSGQMSSMQSSMQQSLRHVQETQQATARFYNEKLSFMEQRHARELAALKQALAEKDREQQQVRLFAQAVSQQMQTLNTSFSRFTLNIQEEMRASSASLDLGQQQAQARALESTRVMAQAAAQIAGLHAELNKLTQACNQAQDRGESIKTAVSSIQQEVSRLQ